MKEIHWLIERSLREIDSSNSATDARTVNAVIHHLEYITTIDGSPEFNSKMVYKTLHRVIRMVLGCKDSPAVTV